MDFLKDIKKTSDLLMNYNEEKFQEIELDEILLDENQPRKKFDENLLEELAISIKNLKIIERFWLSIYEFTNHRHTK